MCACIMRGSKRKLIPRPLLTTLLEEFYSGVPVAKTIKKYRLAISSPHLRKLLFMYMDILDLNQVKSIRTALCDSIFPPWLEDNALVTTQPDTWTYKGKFPFGVWERREFDGRSSS